MTDQPPVPHDPQDPLPETSFRWRRLLTFALSAAFIGLLAGRNFGKLLVKAG
jgi:hypothetical protein